MAVFDPLKVVITNYSEERRNGNSENNPEDENSSFVKCLSAMNFG